MSDGPIYEYSKCPNGHEYLASESHGYGGGTTRYSASNCGECEKERNEKETLLKAAQKINDEAKIDKVGDLTIKEFKNLFKEIIEEIVEEHNKGVSNG